MHDKHGSHDTMARYGDIIDLPRPVSTKHKPMPRSDRAAQFAPFSALTGYDRILERTVQRTLERTEDTKGNDETAQ